MFQVSHAKGKISQLYNLHVLVPTAYILGSDEYHVGVGSTINLVCIIENVSNDVPFTLSAYCSHFLIIFQRNFKYLQKSISQLYSAGELDMSGNRANEYKSTVFSIGCKIKM